MLDGKYLKSPNGNQQTEEATQLTGETFYLVKVILKNNFT